MESTEYHRDVLTVVKDYVEILFMSIVLALLVLKKKLLQDCIIKRMQKIKSPTELEAQTDQ